MNEIILEGDALATAAELSEIARAIRDLESRATVLKSILRGLLSEGDTAISPEGIELVQMRAGSLRFDPAKAVGVLPPSVLASIQVTVADSKKAKEILSPAIYALCCTPSQPSIIVKG